MAIALRTYQTWIANSAKQLDKEVPNWHKKIDLSRLNMGDPDYCICGQLRISHKSNPDFKAKKLPFSRAFTNNLDYSGLRGFYTPPGLEIYGYSGQVRKIQQRLWQHQVAKRLNAKA